MYFYHSRIFVCHLGLSIRCLLYFTIIRYSFTLRQFTPPFNLTREMFQHRLINTRWIRIAVIIAPVAVYCSTMSTDLDTHAPGTDSSDGKGSHMDLLSHDPETRASRDALVAFGPPRYRSVPFTTAVPLGILRALPHQFSRIPEGLIGRQYLLRAIILHSIFSRPNKASTNLCGGTIYLPDRAYVQPQHSSSGQVVQTDISPSIESTLLLINSFVS